MALQAARVRIESPQRIELLRQAQSRLTHRPREHTQSLVVHLQRHRERKPILAAMRERKACRVREAGRGAVDDLGDERKRGNRARTNTWSEKHLGEILRPAIRRRRERAVQATQDYIRRENLAGWS